MMLRFLRSRGARKFRRNRLAMFSLGIIGVYMLLTLWIVAMETVDYMTDGGLQDRPVLGFLLSSRTLERVGPPLQAGFGIKQDAERRTNQYDFLLGLVRQGLLEVGTLTPGSDRTPEQVLARVGMAERRLAAKPVEAIRADLAAAERTFAQMDSLRHKTNHLNTALFAIDEVRTFERDLRQTARRRQNIDPEENAEEHAQVSEEYRRLREDLSFSLEKITFAVTDYLAVADGDDSLREVDLVSLEDAALALLDPDFDLAEHPTIYEESLIEQVGGHARTTLKTLRPRIEAGLDEVEPILARLFPRPTGLDGVLYTLRTSLGTDRQGRSIFIRGVYSGKTAIQVGIVVALLAVSFGSVLGAAAAFYGRWVDHGTVYLFSVFTAIPDLVLLVVLAFMFQAGDWSLPWDREQKVANTLIPIYAAFALTFWIGACRVIRGEAMKIKELEYIQAARAIGFGRLYILLKHLIPNTTHLIFISFSLLFIAAIKGEVVLTFLGLGLKEGASWGIMISQSQPEVVNGFFWQIGAATFFMLVLVLAFNVVSDALQDAFDPRHVG
jgi:ABC-type dipeptide/oligopeptide/nickel transport system permease subunit